jgi:glycosyltransferase involved in cell wall biosynthesis
MFRNIVSVIIPSYNSKNWITDAIDCILNQTYSLCEIIVIDDGSTDGTGELIRGKYGDRIKYIHQQNKGLACARNSGLCHAVGDYIQFLDADDLIHTDKIRCQVDLMRNMDTPAVTYTDYLTCDINDLNRLVPERYLSPLLTSVSPLEEIAQDWETRLSIPVHCFLFDAGIFRNNGVKFDENLPNHEDWDCWMQVFALNPKVQFLNEKMAFYRIRTDGMCTNFQKMRCGFLQAIRKQKKLLGNNMAVKKILGEKEKEIRYLYREFGLWGRIFKYIPHKMRSLIAWFIPYKIQRMFD